MLYGYRAVLGALIALPAAAVLGGFAGSYPRGGRELFDTGGVMPLEAFRLTRRGTPAVLYEGGALVVVAAVLGLFPLGALIAGLGRWEGPLARGKSHEDGWLQQPCIPGSRFVAGQIA